MMLVLVVVGGSLFGSAVLLVASSGLSIGVSILHLDCACGDGRTDGRKQGTIIRPFVSGQAQAFVDTSASCERRTKRPCLAGTIPRLIKQSRQTHNETPSISTNNVTIV